MSTFVFTLGQEPTDSGLPFDFRDGQMNLGTKMAIDFRYDYCSPGTAGAIASGADFNSLVDDADKLLISLAAAPASCVFSDVNKSLSMLTTDQIASSVIDARSTLDIAPGTSYGAVVWFKLPASIANARTGLSHTVCGFPVAGTAAPSKTPGLLTVEKRRRTVTAVDTGSDTMTLAGHGLVNGDRVEFGGSLPGGLSANTLYYVVQTASGAFKVSTTSGGSAVDLTTTGGTFWVMDNIYKPSLYSAIGSNSPSSRELSSDWEIPLEQIVQIAFGWTVTGGSGSAKVIMNGGEASMETSSGGITTLPVSGFENFKLGTGMLPSSTSGQPGGVVYYRSLFEDLGVSGRTLEQMAAEDYAANSSDVLARG